MAKKYSFDASNKIDSFDVFNILPEKEYDAITELASILCQTPLAAISLIIGNQQYYKSCYGFTSLPDPIDQSLCKYTFNQSNPIFSVEDTRLDNRFKGKSYVIDDPKIVFFTGIQLITPSDGIIGVLGVYDHEARILSEMQIKSLQLLANQVVQLIELNKKKIELDQSEKKYKSMIENSIVPILFSDPITERVIDANKAACELFGYSVEEFSKLSREAFIVHDNYSQEILNKRKEAGITGIELIGIKKDGERFPIEGSSSIFKNNNGDIRAISFVNDISKRKKIESENNQLMNNSEVLFVMADSEFKITSFNKQFKKLYKYYFGVDIAVGGSFFEYAHPLDREKEREICNRVINGSSEENEFTIVKDNIKTSFLLKYHPTRDENNTITGIFVTAFDITNRKNTERQLVKRERELSLIYNNVNDVIFLIENEGNNKFKLVSINKPYFKISGLKEEEVIGHYLNDFVPEPTLSNIIMNYQLAISTRNKVSWEFERDYETGVKTIITSVTPIFNSKGVCTQLIGTIHDVTAERMASKDREKLSNELQKIMHSSLDVICTIDEFGHFLTVSSASEKIWGYLPEEIIGKPFINLVIEEDRKRTLFTVGELMNGREYTDFENHYIKKDGTIVPIVWSIKWDEKDRIIYCTAKDASDKQKHEEELISSEKKYKNLFENNPAPMFVWDFESLMIVDCNEEALVKYGYSREEFLQLNIIEIRPSEETPPLYELMRHETQFGNVIQFSTKHLKKNGETISVKINAHIMEYNGRKSSLVLVNDITEKLRIENDIIASERKYKELFENNPGPMFIWDFETLMIVDCNEEALLKYGYTKDEFLQLNLSEIRPHEDMDTFKGLMNNKDIVGKIKELTTRHLKKNGEIIDVKVNGHIIEYNGRKSTLALINDITEKLKVKAEIEASERKYKHLFENNPAPMYIFDFETLSIVDCNDEVLLKYGYTRDEFLLLNMMQIRPIEEVATVKYIIDNADEKGETVVKFTTKHQKKNGELMDVNINAHVLDYNGRKCTLVLIDDVTEKLKHLESLEKQNKILKEIAWMQSHVVRAPLARIMGFIQLINDASIIEEKTELLPYILDSANELDTVIKEIVTKSSIFYKD